MEIDNAHMQTAISLYKLLPFLLLLLIDRPIRKPIAIPTSENLIPNLKLMNPNNIAPIVAKNKE